MVLRVTVQESPSYRNTEIYAGAITSGICFKISKVRKGGIKEGRDKDRPSVDNC